MLMAVLVITVSCGDKKSKSKPNEAKYITDKGKLSMIHSLEKLDLQGALYELNYTADYKLDVLLNKYQAVSLEQLETFLATELYDEVPARSPNMSYGSGCSAFAAAETGTGKYMMGRNFDFAHPKDIAAVLVRTAPKDGYKSISMVDAFWVGCPKGFYTDGVTDLSIMMSFPYLLMDGMNEKGFAVCVLHLDGNPTVQNTGKTRIGTTVALRYLLDNAANVDEAIEILQSFDMDHTSTAGGSYHFFMADASGKSATVEYIYEPGSEYPNTFEPLIGSHYVTNFYISPKMSEHEYGPISEHGLARYNILKNTLEAHDFSLTFDEARLLLKDVCQQKNPEKLTSNTQWSIVYNLSDRTAELYFMKDYAHKYIFSVE